jgi:hypothetical protein
VCTLPSSSRHEWSGSGQNRLHFCTRHAERPLSGGCDSHGPAAAAAVGLRRPLGPCDCPCVPQRPVPLRTAPHYTQGTSSYTTDQHAGSATTQCASDGSQPTTSRGHRAAALRARDGAISGTGCARLCTSSPASSAWSARSAPWGSGAVLMVYATKSTNKPARARCAVNDGPARRTADSAADGRRKSPEAIKSAETASNGPSRPLSRDRRRGADCARGRT